MTYTSVAPLQPLKIGSLVVRMCQQSNFNNCEKSLNLKNWIIILNHFCHSTFYICNYNGIILITSNLMYILVYIYNSYSTVSCLKLLKI